MDSKYARAIAALNTAAQLAKDPNTRSDTIPFMEQNQSYFPNSHKYAGKQLPKNNPSLPKFVPLNKKNKKP